MHPLLDEMREAVHAAGYDKSEDRPKLMLDGRKVDLAREHGSIEGTAALLAASNAKTFPPIAARLDVECLMIGEFRGEDLSALSGCSRLTHLHINWATRLADISPLAQFSGLRYLELADTPKVEDLEPVVSLKKLRAFVFQGGMWNKNRAASLEPISRLPQLEVLVLLNLAVKEDGLRPLARLTGLKALFLSNQFETADYACLAVHLKETACDQFAAFQKFKRDGKYADIMVTGKRKPFLKSWDETDMQRLEKYKREFETLKAGFEAERR